MYYDSSPSSSSWGPYTSPEAMSRVERLAGETAVVIFSISTCCMCHAVKRLFRGFGVSPAVVELDLDPQGKDMEAALAAVAGAGAPVVFVGGKLVGGMDSVMAAHIGGSLVPLLKGAGALWL